MSGFFIFDLMTLVGLVLCQFKTENSVVWPTNFDHLNEQLIPKDDSRFDTQTEKIISIFVEVTEVRQRKEEGLKIIFTSQVENLQYIKQATVPKASMFERIALNPDDDWTRAGKPFFFKVKGVKRTFAQIQQISNEFNSVQLDDL